MARTRALAQAIDGRMILGVGLEADRTAIDAVEAKQLLGGIGRRYVAAMEIGNEPELYTLVPWYRKLHGVPIPWYSHTRTPVFARPVAVGTALRFVGSGCPPRRSQRARVTHWAPGLGFGVEAHVGPGMLDAVGG